MTHFFGIMRGAKEHERRVEVFLEGKMWPWKINKPVTDPKTGKVKMVEETYMAQGHYREIKLFEYVVPRECKETAMRMFGWTKGNTGYWGKGWAKYCVAPLRKLLGAKPIPNIDDAVIHPMYFLPRDAVGIECIGMKDDADSEVNWRTKEEVKEDEKRLVPHGTVKEDI